MSENYGNYFLVVSLMLKFLSWVVLYIGSPAAIVATLDLPEFPPLSFNPEIVPIDGESGKTFADIRLGGSLIDRETYDLDMQKHPIANVPSLFSPSLKLIKITRDELVIKTQVLLVKGDDDINYECFLPLDVNALDYARQADPVSDPLLQLKFLQDKIERLKHTCLQLVRIYLTLI